MADCREADGYRVLLLDIEDVFWEFANASRLLSNWIAPKRTREIDLDGENLEEARDRLFSMWQQSRGWLSYVGHGRHASGASGSSREPVELHRVYILLGDPALRLRVASPDPSPDADPRNDPPGVDVTGEADPVLDARPSSTSGCEIKPSQRAGGPFEPAVLLLGLALLIGRRRTGRKQPRALH